MVEVWRPFRGCLVTQFVGQINVQANILQHLELQNVSDH